jgi:hypothetical protein
MSIPTGQSELRDVVPPRYAAAASVATGENASAATCCGAEGAIMTEEQRESFGSELYDADAREELPEEAALDESTDVEAGSCCSTTEQKTCCEPTDKATCCSPEATAAGACGCH